jgi:hypothetical protein
MQWKCTLAKPDHLRRIGPLGEDELFMGLLVAPLAKYLQVVQVLPYLGSVCHWRLVMDH